MRAGKLRFVLTGAGMMDGNTVIERSTWVEQNCRPVLTVGGEGGTLHECTVG